MLGLATGTNDSTDNLVAYASERRQLEFPQAQARHSRWVLARLPAVGDGVQIALGNVSGHDKQRGCTHAADTAALDLDDDIVLFKRLGGP